MLSAEFYRVTFFSNAFYSNAFYSNAFYSEAFCRDKFYSDRLVVLRSTDVRGTLSTLLDIATKYSSSASASVPLRVRQI